MPESGSFSGDSGDSSGCGWWRQVYNWEKPHSSLGGKTSIEAKFEKNLN